MSKSEFLWCEEYRPRSIDDCILPDDIKSTFKKIVDTGEMHNMLLSGTSGLGKTTVAKALCHELNLDYILINSSEDSGIDVLRNRIRQFASSISLNGSDSYKVVILDEADYLNAQSTQPALRAFIEEFSTNCRFIFTCNYRNKIIEPLQSRCAVVEFNTTKKHLAGLAAQFHKRLSNILKEKEVSMMNVYLQSLLCSTHLTGVEFLTRFSVIVSMVSYRLALWSERLSVKSELLSDSLEKRISSLCEDG